MKKTGDIKFTLEIIREEIKKMSSDLEREIRDKTNKFNKELDDLLRSKREPEPNEKEGLFIQIKRRLLK